MKIMGSGLFFDAVLYFFTPFNAPVGKVFALQCHDNIFYLADTVQS